MNEGELLADCYRNSLALALTHGIQSIAFPCISTGAYGYPGVAAAKIALEVMGAREQEFLKIMVCCFHVEDLSLYSRLLRARTGAH